MSDALGEERFDRINAMLMEVYGYYRQEIRETEILMWHKALQPFSLEEISAAFHVHIDRSDFLPRISSIKLLIAPRSKALVFEELQRNVMKVGPYGTPAFRQAETEPVVLLLGGWMTVCSEMPHPSMSHAWDAYRKRVEELYEPATVALQMQAQMALGHTTPAVTYEAPQPHV
jgi:hypothetical protein